jgi:chemotaxis protein methyltransferase CheR
MSLSTSDYNFVRALAAQESALALGDHKSYLVEARLAPIAEREGCASVTDLVTQIRTGSAALRADVVESLTTNETSFFRDVHPFDALRDVLMPTAIEARGRAAIWSAAASTGQEAYSVAMIAANHFPTASVSILGTDLSRGVLTKAAAGEFTQLEVNRGLPVAMLVRHFERVGPRWRISEDIRRRVHFKELNLARPWPSLARMDVVLLRNVLIYFDAEAKRAALAQVARVLAPGGVLFLGGAETTHGLSDDWQRIVAGRTVFYRPSTPLAEGQR